MRWDPLLISHVSQIELRTVSMIHNVTNTWFLYGRVQRRPAWLTIEKLQASVRSGQSGQLFRPVKSAAAGKIVSDHVIIM